jgi:hypothetical protein
MRYIREVVIMVLLKSAVINHRAEKCKDAQASSNSVFKVELLFK